MKDVAYKIMLLKVIRKTQTNSNSIVSLLKKSHLSSCIVYVKLLTAFKDYYICKAALRTEKKN